MGALSDDQHKEIISWLDHGKAFRIHDRRAFEQQILPTHFRKSSQFKSFQRKLSRWGFLKVPNGEDAGAYYHASFQRGDYRSLSQISTISIATKATSTRTTSQEPSAHEDDCAPPRQSQRQEYEARARAMSEKIADQTTRNPSSLSSSAGRRVQTVSPPFRGGSEEDQQGINKNSATNSASLLSQQQDPQGQQDNSTSDALRRMIESAMTSAYNEGGFGGRPNHHQVIQALQDNRRIASNGAAAGIGDASSTLREDSDTAALANALSDLLCANHRQEVQQPQEQIAGAAQRREHRRSRDEIAAAHRLASLVGEGGGSLCPHPPGHPNATDLMIQMAAIGQLGRKNALYQLPTTSAVTHDARNAAMLPSTQQLQPSHHLSMQHLIEGFISHRHQQRPEQQQLLTDDSSSNRHLMGLLSLLQSSTGIPAAVPPSSSLLQSQEQHALLALLSSSSQHQDCLSNAVQAQQVALPSILPSSSSVIAQHAIPTAAISEQHISMENNSTLRLIRDLLLMAPQSGTQPKSAR